MLHESGDISQEQFEIYNRWFNEFLEDVVMTGIIYLKTDPQVCFDRCTSRARKGENTISLEYLNNCSSMHDKWINNDCINTLELSNNSEEEIEEVEMFILDELDDEVEPQDSIVYKSASFLCLCVVVVAYILKSVYVFDSIMK
jgi:deoxyadenosine/deoxycytidine kinase